MLQNFYKNLSVYNILMSFVNDILKKNLEFIKQYDESLCERLMEIDSLTESIQLIYTEKNEANLSYNNFPINEQAGAVQEAQRIVCSLTHNVPSSIHVVIGMGFGYIFSSLVETSKGFVILYEPNIQLLRVALEMVDLSAYLQKSNVFITDNLNMLEAHFAKCFMPTSKTAVLGCHYYRINKNNGLDELIQKLSKLQGVYAANAKQRAKEGADFACHVCRNLPVLLNCQPITVLKDSLKGKPAIIAAAGPSLGDNLETIKQNRDKFVLFAVSSSVGTLIKNNITPDFVSIIEKFDSSGLVKDYSLKDISLIAEPYTHLNVLNLPFKEKFISSSVENSANEIYNRMFNIDNFYFETKGTVAYNALYSAMYMGCNPIILVGQDLAYIDGECYSKNSPLSEYKCRKTDIGWEIYVANMEKLQKSLYPNWAINDERLLLTINNRIKQLNSQLVNAKTAFGEDVATSVTFALFAEYYKSFANEYSQKIKLYNTTKKGIDIGKYEYSELDNILKQYDNINITSNYKKLNISLDTNLFETERGYINEVIKKINSYKAVFDELKTQIDDNTAADKKDVLRNIQLLMEAYVSINSSYMSESFLYKELTFASQQAFTGFYEDSDNYLKNIKLIFDVLNIFYNDDFARLSRALKCLTWVEGKLKNEGCFTKS